MLNGPLRLTTRWPAWGPSVTTACRFSIGMRRDCRGQSASRSLKFCYNPGRSGSQVIVRVGLPCASPGGAAELLGKDEDTQTIAHLKVSLSGRDFLCCS